MLKVNKNVEVALNTIEVLRLAATPRRVSELAKDSRIKTTECFLEQIVRKLRIAGITRSVRGPGGGVALVRGKQVSVLQVVEALGHDVEPGNSMSASLPERLRARVYGVLSEVQLDT
jgi:DNA-binding IscR family transcriptional regulator